MSTIEVIVSGYINNQEKVDSYKKVAGAVMKKYGAVMPPNSYAVTKVIAGQSTPSFMLRIEFPDKQKAEQAFIDPDYISVIKDRDEGFGDLSIMMVE